MSSKVMGCSATSVLNRLNCRNSWNMSCSFQVDLLGRRCSTLSKGITWTYSHPDKFFMPRHIFKLNPGLLNFICCFCFDCINLLLHRRKNFLGTNSMINSCNDNALKQCNFYHTTGMAINHLIRNKYQVFSSCLTLIYQSWPEKMKSHPAFCSRLSLSAAALQLYAPTLSLTAQTQTIKIAEAQFHFAFPWGMRLNSKVIVSLMQFTCRWPTEYATYFVCWICMVNLQLRKPALMTG